MVGIHSSQYSNFTMLIRIVNWQIRLTVSKSSETTLLNIPLRIRAKPSGQFKIKESDALVGTPQASFEDVDRSSFNLRDARFVAHIVLYLSLQYHAAKY